MDEPDFFLYQWQLNEAGHWIDSKGETRRLPPAAEHRKDLCVCPLCHPDRWAEPRYHKREMERLREQAEKTWEELGKMKE